MVTQNTHDGPNTMGKCMREMDNCLLAVRQIRSHGATARSKAMVPKTITPKGRLNLQQPRHRDATQRPPANNPGCAELFIDVRHNPQPPWGRLVHPDRTNVLVDL